MDKDRFNDLVKKTRHIFFDPRSERRETPAKTWADYYKALSGFGDEQEQFLHELIADSKKTKLSWDAVSLIAQEHIREEWTLPPELRDWVIGVLARKEEWERPTKRAQATSERDRQVCIAIASLMKQFGLPPMRNISQTIDGKKSDWPHCCAEGGSACDVVGKALGEVGYKAIEKCWTNRDPLLKHPPNHQGEEIRRVALSPQGWTGQSRVLPKTEKK